MARRLTSSDWDAVLGSSSLRRISDSKPYMMKPHLVYIFKKRKKEKETRRCQKSSGRRAASKKSERGRESKRLPEREIDVKQGSRW